MFNRRTNRRPVRKVYESRRYATRRRLNESVEDVFSKYGLTGLYGRGADIDYFDERQLDSFLRKLSGAGVNTEGCKIWACDPECLCLVKLRKGWGPCAAISELGDTGEYYVCRGVAEDDMDTDLPIAGTASMEDIEDSQMWEFEGDEEPYQQVSLRKLAQIFNTLG